MLKFPFKNTSNFTFYQQRFLTTVQPGKFSSPVKSINNVILDTEHVSLMLNYDGYYSSKNCVIGSLTHNPRFHCKSSKLSEIDFLNGKKPQYMEYHEVEKRSVETSFIKSGFDSPANLYFENKDVIQAIEKNPDKFHGNPDDGN